MIGVLEDCDPDIPVLIAAKSGYAKLKITIRDLRFYVAAA
jgi:hypothetical protein